MGTSLTLFQLRHMGGAMARSAAHAGARATLPGEVSLFTLGVVEEPADASEFFDAATWRRLREVKAVYDPQDLFKAANYVPSVPETGTSSPKFGLRPL